MKKVVSLFGEESELFYALNQRAESYARSLNLEYHWAPQSPFSEENAIRELKKADAGIIDIEPYGESVFSQIKDTSKLLIRFGVGYDKVDLAAASRHGIAIARTAGANTTAVAEMALTLMLSCKRKLNQSQRRVRTGVWTKEVGHEIIGSTIGIIGYGCIGRRFARLIKGFDCHILVYDPYTQKDPSGNEEVEFVSPEELFSRSDAISIHIPYTDETHHLINARLLSLMKPAGVIVNTSRGGVVDETALYHALQSGQIAGAGIDVFEKEPLPPDSPLLTLENIVLTPHVSSQTVESLWNIYKMALDISADFFGDKGSPYILNQDYKKSLS